MRQRATLTQEQGTHRSQPTRTQPNRKCKARSKTQFEPESNSAIGQHLLESNECARNYSDSRFKTEVESRTQSSRPRPRTQKKPRPRTDPLEAKDRNARSQGRGPRTHSGVAKGGGGGYTPPLACQPKCRIRKIPRF